MNAWQLKVCTNCPHMVVYEFTITGTDHLAPQPLRDLEVAEYLREGWTVTYHDHAGPQEPD